MQKTLKVGKRKKRKKPNKAIIIDFAGKIVKARFINDTPELFRGSDLDRAYKAMRKGLFEYKRKLREKLEKEAIENA